MFFGLVSVQSEMPGFVQLRRTIFGCLPRRTVFQCGWVRPEKFTAAILSLISGLTNSINRQDTSEGGPAVKHDLLKYLLPALLVLTAVSCAQQRPVLYPNAHLKSVGQTTARADIDECLQLAVDYGAGEDGGARVAGDTAKGAAVGGAAGAAVGAVTGNLGRGAAAGAAGGGAAAMTRSALNSGNPDPVFKKFVEQCLRDKGYQPIGWR